MDIPDTDQMLPQSSSILEMYEKAAVCSDVDLCSKIGRQMLQDGGNAVDAALATLLCNGLLALQSMGLGGGMIMIVYVREKKQSYCILSREFAANNISTKSFLNVKSGLDLQRSSHSIAVPTELMGYATAHKHFGKLPWKKLVLPTVQLCHKGFKLSKHQRDALVMNKDMVMHDKHLHKMFIDSKTGNFKRVYAHIQPPNELCRTYEHIMDKGPKSFYEKNFKKLLLKDLTDIGSAISSDDIENIPIQLVNGIVLPLDDYNIHLTPAPGSGCILGFIMNILKVFKENFEKVDSFGSLEIHRIAEALKFGFVKRWELDESSKSKIYEDMLCPEYAQKVASLINNSHVHNGAKFYGAPKNIDAWKQKGTSHISIVAPNGDAVSVTSSINFYFGSGRMGNRTGVLFNNALSDFSYNHLSNYFGLPHLPGKNYIRAKKSPMSSMTPLIVTKRKSGQVRLVVGAAGGTKIISALTQLLIRILWQNLDIKSAIDAARFHHQLLPDKLEYEFGILHEHLKELKNMGHHLERYENRGSAICGIEKKIILFLPIAIIVKKEA